MALGKQAQARYDGACAGELLTDLAAEATIRAQSQIREWAAIAAWADQSVVDTTEGAATLLAGVIDTGVPIAGDGAPLVSEFALMELIAVLGRSPDGGRAYVGRVIECAWRLPNVWTAVMSGRLAPWRAERIADLTRGLNKEAAGFVDRQLFNAAGVGWAQIERLVDEAILRHDPDAAETRRKTAIDDLHVEISGVDINGTVHLDACLDAADGRDFDHALTRRAQVLGHCGDETSLEVRRAKAVGDLARHDLTLELEFTTTNGETRTVPSRRAVLNLHLTDTALTGGNPLGRWGDTQTPISVEQIRQWLGDRTGTIIIRPIIDLAGCAPVDSYEIPHRHRRQVVERDHTCRFPGCPTAASRCDLDHQTPHAEGGATCPCNLIPLCRRHHRAKTFSLWRYVTITPAHYLWISPNRRFFLVSPDGTKALDLPHTTDVDDWRPPE